MSNLPPTATRCTPEAHRCPFAYCCARANDWPHYATFEIVDASLCLPFGDCPMFVELRETALLEAA